MNIHDSNTNLSKIQMEPMKIPEIKPSSDLLKRQILLFIITFLANASIHVIRVAWSVLKSEIRDQYNWDTSTLGLIDSMFLLSYAIGLIFNGPLGDKYSRKIVIFLGILLTSLSTICVFLHYALYEFAYRFL